MQVLTNCWLIETGLPSHRIRNECGFHVLDYSVSVQKSTELKCSD